MLRDVVLGGADLGGGGGYSTTGSGCRRERGGYS